MAFFKHNTDSESKTTNWFGKVVTAVLFFAVLWFVTEWIGVIPITYGLD